MVTSSFSQSIKQHSVNLLPTSRQLPEKPDFIHTGRADNPYTMALRLGDTPLEALIDPVVYLRFEPHDTALTKVGTARELPGLFEPVDVPLAIGHAAENFGKSK